MQVAQVKPKSLEGVLAGIDSLLTLIDEPGGRMNWLKKLMGSPAEKVRGAPPGQGAYELYGLDLAPDSAPELAWDDVRERLHEARVLSEHGDWMETVNGKDYSAILWFNKQGGMWEAVISARTASGFLGMGSANPEEVWLGLGYVLKEDLGQRKMWAADHSRIVGHFSEPGRLDEIHYVIPDPWAAAPSDLTAGWRQLGFQSGGGGCVESADTVVGIAFDDPRAVSDIVRYLKEEWTESAPQGFWVVTGEAFDHSDPRVHCIGFDSRHEASSVKLVAAMRAARCWPESEPRAFALDRLDFLQQVRFVAVHLRGLLPLAEA